MREDVKKFLAEHNITVELKAYKELQTNNGYHMLGKLYINNKQAFYCEDGGFGGGCDVRVLNDTNAKPLLDIKKELSKLKAYPGDEKIGDLDYEIDTLFYELAEDLLILKEMKKLSKKKTLVMFEDVEYTKGEYLVFNHICNLAMINNLIERMEVEDYVSIQIWNLEQDWVEYSLEELKKRL